MKVYEVMELIDWLKGLITFAENPYIEDSILDLMATLAMGNVSFDEE